MLLTRARQAVALLGPTARVMSWHPPGWAAVLALAYVAAEARSGFVDYRILVLRLAALLLALGAAFALDDPTEETIGHVPTPLLLRRGLRVALLLPFVSAAWGVLLYAAGGVPAVEGGPMPTGDLTLEAATLLAVALCAACAGARLTSDRLGGIAAAPVVLALVAVTMLLPADQRMILGSPADERWADAHEWWRALLAASCVAFVWLSRSAGSRGAASRLQLRREAARAV